MVARTLTQPALADLADLAERGVTSRWVRSGRLRLHALDYGGSAPPLLVLPGITSPAVTMDFVARQLTDLVRPVVLDVRGRGLSDDGDSYDLPAYARDTAAVIAALDLDRPLLLGHSMGARIAAATAADGATALRGVILADPQMSGPGRDPYPTTLEAFQSQLAQARRGVDADEVARSWPRWPRQEQELRARWLASCGDEAIAATHRGFETEDFFRTWPHVTQPAELLYGADSPVVPADGAREAAQALPAARLTSVPDAGHMIFWDSPDASLTLLRDCLGRLSS